MRVNASLSLLIITVVAIIGDILCYLIQGNIPDSLANATLVLVGGSAGVSLPDHKSSENVGQ